MRSHPNGQTCSTSRILDENVWLFSQGFRHLSEYTIWAFSYTFENKQCNCKPSYVCFRIRLFFLWWLLKFRSHFYFIFSIGWIVNFSRLLSAPLWLRSIFFLDRFQIDSDGIVRTITSGLPENRVFNLKVKAKETGRYIVLQWRWLLCLSVFHITNQIDVFDEMPLSRLSLMGNALKVLKSFSAGLYCHRKNLFLYSAS